MPAPSKYTETDERRVWDCFAEGMIFKQVVAECGLPIATIYRLLEKATIKWGNPKP
jgi:hypothetical protein